MEILRQLGELFLQAVPTVIIVFLFYFFMRWAFFTPIQKAMDERRERIEGAREEAARAKAEAKKDGEDLKVFVELQDVNYPGSTYTLTYQPATDRLVGTYFHAVSGQNMDVEFGRLGEP